MIQRIADLAFASDFVRIYKSANRLFPEEARSTVTEEVFLPQLRQDENYGFWDEDGCMVGFYSYHVLGAAWELTSLYVDFEHQKSRIGERMLAHFESNIPAVELFLLKH